MKNKKLLWALLALAAAAALFFLFRDKEEPADPQKPDKIEVEIVQGDGQPLPQLPTPPDRIHDGSTPVYGPPSTPKSDTDAPLSSAKPVIYLYPEEVMEVSVKLDYDGLLWSSWPKYEDGWTVIARPDGTLTDAAGHEYSYLFWDGFSDTEFDFSTGFCVAGADTGEFLREVLAEMGLTPAEYNEFIVYWMPLMEGNAYNLISFQSDIYTEMAKLSIDPAPDSLLRVFMAWKPLEEPVEIEPQTFAPFIRTGFTVVEWGGAKLED